MVPASLLRSRPLGAPEFSFWPNRSPVRPLRTWASGFQQRNGVFTTILFGSKSSAPPPPKIISKKWVLLVTVPRGAAEKKHPKHPKRTPQRDPACVHLNSCVNPSRAQTCVVCNEWSRGRVSAEQKIPKMLKMAKTGCGGQAAVRPKSLKRSIGPEGAAWPKCPKRAAAQRPLAPKRQLGWREAPAAKSS